MFVTCSVLFIDADVFMGASFRKILSLKTTPAKILPYAIVKAIPTRNKAAPAIKMIYVICTLTNK